MFKFEFDPNKVQSFKEIPDDQKENFAKVSKKGFVRKEVIENDKETAKLMEIAREIKGKDIKLEDVLHAGVEKTKNDALAIISSEWTWESDQRLQEIFRDLPELLGDKDFILQAVMAKGGAERTYISGYF